MVRTAVVAFFLIPTMACGAQDTSGDDAASADRPAPSDGLPANARLLEEAASGLEPTARERWPDSFAGLWIDHNTGTVKIAFTQDASGKVEELARDSTHPELLQAVPLELSFTELEELQHRMIVDRELAKAGELSLPPEWPSHYDLGIDLDRNAVKVRLEDPNPEAIAAFHERYGDDLVFEQGIFHPGEGGNP